ncbi:hypothetical protein [Clostridium septicum]|uniref:Iron-only hydrogenase system regulator n=1 Tax=Clostridium septicum TaxID=1504 RepID=A0A9N7JKH0_CLOSE|nr:hypothetical protein [Clostridium septicum]AYE33531.1 hypothetical protein CP523_03140 [Clostridium septicum]MDU1313804.1 hypothetical protein [Clostridium septicum]QAS61694.1 hypothetical protein EI377_13655 [Clostridium septicum]UEC21860.1 hypothetical protein LK444_05720 [Clostridium septicum]USS00087.1 hypothetical protein NH397_11360 [Clostridium septicum]
MFTIMAIKIEPRDSAAPKVQEVLTKFGCIIQTRLGLHEASKNICSNSGLVILNLIHEEKEEISKLSNELNEIKGVVAKLVEV